MSQRIRYQTVQPGLLRSRRNFTINTGQEVIVELDLNNKKYRVLDVNTGVEVIPFSGNTKNTSVLKILAKKQLSGLGVLFGDEKRERNQATTLV